MRSVALQRPSPTERPTSSESPSSPAAPSLPARPARVRTGRPNAFEAAGSEYHAVRPSYPEAWVDWVLEALPARPDVVEIGVGTGLFTAQLAERRPASMRVVLARDVADRARRIRALPGTGEATGLAEASAGVVVKAHAWHWLDVPAASAEAARVLRPGGRLAAVWNQLDTTVPWVHRLTRIMHAGDVHAAAPQQRRFAAPFGVEEHARWSWSMELTPAQLHGLMASRSYWLRAGERTRERMTANLDWYLHEHLGHAEDAVLTVPYLTVAWRARRPRRR
ncbi:methyltransferase domain-containing protein [Micrococcus lylae]|uniref:class I SAM-dependent methyltransferase n=1 Tax=Micrococcus lylae TaxID=1273 RepID=UPI0021A8D9F0|nr:methyltransferase domain-containing protein [Micrococcus lylae]MCT2007540.1 methyltransferase domain-containing protein [Micrococcus lylae]MCT2071327.1 methyltransferase domain-containing protein [Micrococcus lylae]